MNEAIRDLKYALRRLARTPGFTIATVATLALGIGANTAIFSVINGVLLKPLPYYEPERLIGVWQKAPGVKIADLNASIADYFTYLEQSRSFEGVALWRGEAATVTEFTPPERIDVLAATFQLLPLLGVQPVLGRPFRQQDNQSGSPEVVMLTHGYWQRKFGGDRGVIGRRIRVDGSAREIIGVLPQGFWFMDMKHDLLMPLRFDRAAVRLAGYNFRCVARLRRGVTIAEANSDIARMIDLEIRSFPPPQGLSIGMMYDAKLGPNARPLIQDLLGDIGKTLWVIMGTIGIVLLIACANVANLLLVRTEGRSQEITVRAALGAGRGRIARELLLESLSLAVLGGITGVGFAYALVKLVLYLGPARLPRLEQITVDSTAILFTLAISLVCGLAFGAIPVLRHDGAHLNESLRAGGRNLSSGRERSLVRNGLTVIQVGLALVLLIGSGLMLRTFDSIRRVHPGFTDAATIQTLRVSIPRDAVQSAESLPRVHQAIAERLAAVPGTVSASLINGLPMTGFSSQDPIAAQDRQYAADQIPPLRRFIRVAPGIFETLGTGLAAGRDYTWTDIHQKRQVVIISENFAREYWGSAQAAIGKQIRSNPRDNWSEIIGVARDIRHDGAEHKAPAAVYWPLQPSYTMSFVVRTPRAGSESLLADVQKAVWSAHAGVPITDLRTLRQIYDTSMSRTAFTLTLLAISGIMALLLAAVGIYAVVSYTVALRTREIGIRMALGAQTAALQLTFVRRGVVWAAIGTVAGLAAAAALSRLMSALLFEISPLDPLTYSVVAAGLVVAAALASYVPARRVTRVDPVEALRAE